MRFVLAVGVLLAAGAGLVLSSGGCGGGGGAGPGAGTNGFVGTYFFLGMGGREIPPPMQVSTWWGTAVSGGLGSHTISTTANTLGTIAGPTPPEGFSYTIGGDRSITWQDGASGPTFLEGWISANGRLLVLAQMEAGSSPDMAVLLRREGTFTVASLNGDYHLAGWSHHVPSGENTSHFGWVTFDGAGTGTYVGRGNVEGTLPAVGALNFTYTVAGDGTFQMDFLGGWSWWGGIHAGGELAVVSGALDGTDFPVLQALVKESTPASPASAATFSGEYCLTGMQHAFGAPAFRGMSGRATADGTGGLDVTFTHNLEGTVATDPPESATYTVDADGEVILTAGGGEVYQGGVAPSGDVVILGGPNTLGADPGFYVLIR